VISRAVSCVSLMNVILVEAKAGEARGPHLTVEGTEEKLIQPDFSMASETMEEAEKELSSSTVAWLQRAGSTVVDDASKRFYEYPTVTTSGTTSNVAAETNLVEVDATGETIDETEVKVPVSDNMKVPEFVPRAIPARYGSFHSTATNRNFEGGQSDGEKAAQPDWVSNYYKHTQTETNTFYGHSPQATPSQETNLPLGSPVSGNGQTSSQAGSPATGTALPVKLGSTESEVPAIAPYDAAAAAYDNYKAWFQEPAPMDTDSTISDGHIATVVPEGGLGLNSDTQNVAGSEEGAVPLTFFQHGGTGGTLAPAGVATEGPALEIENEGDDDDNGGDDGDDGDVGDDAVEGEIDSALTTSSPSESEQPYLSSFGSATMVPGTSPTPATTMATPTVASSAAPPHAMALQGTESNANVTAGSSPVLVEVENGITYYSDSVAASPVYVEATGSSDLTEHKEDVFESLEPLLSGYFESMFGEHFIEEYTLTITYVQSQDSIHQLRRGSEAKTFVTELIILVVFHLRTQDKTELAVFTDTAATEAVQAFFDISNADLTTFLRMLSAKGLHIRDVHAQGQPHPPRNHAMEHGISHITPSNGTASAESMSDDQGTKIAVITSVVCVLLAVVAVIGGVCYGRVRAMLDTTSDLASDYGSHSQNSILASDFGSRAQDSIESIKSRIRSARSRGYFKFGRGQSSAASVKSEASSTLSYIQPAAIQLRRKRGIPVPQDDTPLPGRQDDYHFEDPGKPSSIYDIDVDDEADLYGTRRVVYQTDLASVPDEGNYDSQCGDSSDDDTFISRQSKLSLDRISIARSVKADEESREKVSKKENRHEKKMGRGYDYSSRGAPSTVHSDSASSYEPESILHPASRTPSRATTSSYRRDPDDYLMTQQSFAPLSPLSSLLAEAMGDSPKPLTRTASRPKSPAATRRRGMDPPPSHAYATEYTYRSGAYVTPPTSMHDIMPDEYLNKKRWQDEEADTTVDLPDHVSTNMSTYSVATRTSEAESSYMSGLTTERQLVVFDGEKQQSRTSHKQNRVPRKRMPSNLAGFNL
jgi:hypothetical protein